MELASEHRADTRPKGSEHKELMWSTSSGADSDQRNSEDGLESLFPVYGWGDMLETNPQIKGLECNHLTGSPKSLMRLT